MKVLLVDDDESNRITLTAILEDEGCEVTCVASWTEARKRAGEPWDCVVLDRMLGDGDGVALVPLFRVRDTRVVLFTGDTGSVPANIDVDLILSKGEGPDLLTAFLRRKWG